jgi:hypothetical protein
MADLPDAPHTHPLPSATSTARPIPRMRFITHPCFALPPQVAELERQDEPHAGASEIELHIA